MRKILLVLPMVCAALAAFSDCNSGNCPKDCGPRCCPQERAGNSSDAAITLRVKKALAKTRGISSSARKVSVCTRNCVVVLSGMVENQDEMQKVVRVAEHVHGVMSVDNRLSVREN